MHIPTLHASTHSRPGPSRITADLLMSATVPSKTGHRGNSADSMGAVLARARLQIRHAEPGARTACRGGFGSSGGRDRGGHGR